VAPKPAAGKPAPRSASVAPPVASAGARKLVILHFNDVYEIDARKREPVGGVARFVHLLSTYDAEDPCVIFSGDFLAPSLLSTSTHGLHMVPFFNRMRIKAAVLGNRARSLRRASHAAHAERARPLRPHPLSLTLSRAHRIRARVPRLPRPHIAPGLQMTSTTASSTRTQRWLPATSPSSSPT
jgi:hypothetical protein